MSCNPGCLTSAYSQLTDFVVLFPALWENPPSCHHGAECQLQIHQGRGECGVCAESCADLWYRAVFVSARCLAKLSDGAAACDQRIKLLGSVEAAEDAALRVQHEESAR